MKFKMTNAIYAGTAVFKIIVFVVLIVFFEINFTAYDKIEAGKTVYYGNMLQRFCIFVELITIGVEIVLALVTIAKGLIQKKDFNEATATSIGTKEAPESALTELANYKKEKSEKAHAHGGGPTEREEESEITEVDS